MKILNPPSLARPKGYSHGLMAAGTIVIIAGQIAWDKNGRIVSDDFCAQFSRTLENVLAVVREAGGRAENLVRLGIFVTDKQEYLSALKPIGAEYRRLLGRHFPAMTLVEVKALLEPGAKVEIEGLAVV